MASPVIEWRAATTPFAVLTSIALTGTGYQGAIPCGTTSTAVTVRIYNNFLGVGSIADALNCVLAVYDDTVHQGVGINPPTTGLYIQVQVTDYNGNNTGADAQYYAVGGQSKHPISVNAGTIGGAVTNYVSVNVKAVIPSGATQGPVSQGLWVEFNANS